MFTYNHLGNLHWKALQYLWEITGILVSSFALDFVVLITDMHIGQMLRFPSHTYPHPTPRSFSYIIFKVYLRQIFGSVRGTANMNG